MSLVDAIPQTIKQIGQIKAGGVAARGQWGQSLADVGQMVGQIPNQLATQKANQQRTQLTDLEIKRQTREAAADQAIQGAMSAALNPDGSIDTAKLQQHLAGTPAASAFPKIVESLNQMQKTSADLQTSRINAKDAEDDTLGALGNAAEQLDNPHDQAGLILAGLASGGKTGTIRPDRVKALTAGMLGDDGQPDPVKVKDAIKTLKAGSKEQRQLGATDAARAASAENAKSIAEERAARTVQIQEGADQKKLSTAVTNASRQLSGATSQAQYGRIYAGLSDEAKAYFDAPENWSADSKQRAEDVLLTPAERETRRHDQAAEVATNTLRAETERKNKVDEDAAKAVRAETKRYHDAQIAKGKTGGTDDAAYKRDLEEYKLFVAQWADVQKTKVPLLDEKGSPVLGEDQKAIRPYEPPPTLEKWRVMTPAERSGLNADPKARIDDAEMQRRMSAGATPAGQPAKTVTVDELTKIAKAKGTTVDVQRDRAIAAGYAVVK